MMDSFFRLHYCSVYEIYPQSETPRLTKIAHLDSGPNQGEDQPVHLLPGTVILFGFDYGFDNRRIVFTVWDYRLNHSISFSVDVDYDECRQSIDVEFILSKALKLTSDSSVGR